jgi:hypothetical protein
MIPLESKSQMSLLKLGDAILVENEGCRLMMFHVSQTPIVNEKELLFWTSKGDMQINIDFYLEGKSKAEKIYLLVREQDDSE